MDRKVTWKRERLLKSIDSRQICSAQAEQLSMNNQYLFLRGNGGSLRRGSRHTHCDAFILVLKRCSAGHPNHSSTVSNVAGWRKRSLIFSHKQGCKDTLNSGYINTHVCNWICRSISFMYTDTSTHVHIWKHLPCQTGRVIGLEVNGRIKGLRCDVFTFLILLPCLNPPRPRVPLTRLVLSKFY